MRLRVDMTEHCRFIAPVASKRPIAIHYAIGIDPGRNALLGTGECMGDSAPAPKALAGRGALE
jgi:hypothetical protein